VTTFQGARSNGEQFSGAIRNVRSHRSTNTRNALICKGASHISNAGRGGPRDYPSPTHTDDTLGRWIRTQRLSHSCDSSILPSLGTGSRWTRRLQFDQIAVVEDRVLGSKSLDRCIGSRLRAIVVFSITGRSEQDESACAVDRGGRSWSKTDAS